jgi:hypothetical protein
VTSVRELVVLDVPDGAALESQSGLQMRRPRVYGAIVGPRKASVGMIVMHPASNFMGHYLLDGFADRGAQVLALNSRYVNNDTTLIMEQVIQDLGAGVRFLRERGVERLVLVGNSGGAALMCFYQAQAEALTIDTTPAGDPIRIDPAQLPTADGIALVAAHLGRPDLLCHWLDASMVDERDSLAAIRELDIYDPEHGIPLERALVERVRRRQRERHDRITAYVRRRLAYLRSQPDGPTDEPLVVHRTYADPRFVDVTLDPNDRAPGANRGSPRDVNYGPNCLGRYSTLTSWLSQWSLDSRARGPANLAETTVPVLQLEYSADQAVFPSDIAAWSAACAGREEHRVLKGATHYLTNQPELLEEVVGALEAFADRV